MTEQWVIKLTLVWQVQIGCIKLAGEGHRAAWHVRVLGDILGLVSMYIT